MASGSAPFGDEIARKDRRAVAFERFGVEPKLSGKRAVELDQPRFRNRCRLHTGIEIGRQPGVAVVEAECGHL
ncbi:hypothetical protein Q1M63_22535 [Sinorhizobium meliloti]|nr:hypothetical protein Q1M63_22535 [Sinorhizobium meliloti]